VDVVGEHSVALDIRRATRSHGEGREEATQAGKKIGKTSL
jgi:hypothetical protein